MEVEVPWLLDAIKALGVAGGPVFAALWWLERMDNRALRKEGRENLVQVLSVANTTANSVNDATKAIAAVGQGSRDEVESIKQLAQLIHTLNALLQGGRKIA